MQQEQIKKIIVPQGTVCVKLTCIAQGKSQNSKSCDRFTGGAGIGFPDAELNTQYRE